MQCSVLCPLELRLSTPAACAAAPAPALSVCPTLTRESVFCPPPAGIQILRYQQKQAYIAHNDFFVLGTSQDFNWDPVERTHDAPMSLCNYFPAPYVHAD